MARTNKRLHEKGTAVQQTNSTHCHNYCRKNKPSSASIKSSLNSQISQTKAGTHLSETPRNHRNLPQNQPKLITPPQRNTWKHRQVRRKGLNTRKKHPNISGQLHWPPSMRPWICPTSPGNSLRKTPQSQSPARGTSSTCWLPGSSAALVLTAQLNYKVSVIYLSLIHIWRCRRS